MQCQIVQQTYEKVVFKLVLTGRCSQSRIDDLRKEIIDHYVPILGEDMDITLEIVDEIVPTRTGKRQIVVSHLQQGNGTGH